MIISSLKNNRIKWLIFVLLLLSSTLSFAAEGSTASNNITHRMTVLVIQLGVILFAAKLCNILFEKLNLPGVLGELIAGIIVGPYLLGGTSLPGFPEGLFPIANPDFPISPELYGICTVASVVLLFMVGLDTDIKLLMKYSLVGGLAGIGGVLFSFVLGDVTTMLFSNIIFGQSLGFFAPPCLFLGIISTATSVGITSRILSEQRKIDSPEGVTILSAAVIDDVLGIILLAIGLGVITASSGAGNIDWAHIGIIAVKAIGIWLIATVIGIVASQKISTILKLFGDRISISVMAFGLALVLAGLFEEAGLAMIVGAYVMGLSLSKTDINHVITENLNSIYALLVPVFFTTMGMLVNIRLLASKEVLIFGLVYTIMASAAKVAGSGLPALFHGFNTIGALRIGVGMLPRAEVALIIAGIGISTGVLPQAMFGAIILMVLVTSIVSPQLLVSLFKNAKIGLRKPIPIERGIEIPFHFPSIQVAQLLTGKLIETYESEGFFVHCLDQRKKIYQARKNGTVIDLQNKGGDIIFNCSKKDIPLVNTAMYEVISEFESIVKELKKPIDEKAIVRKIQEKVPGTFERKKLAEYLSENELIPNLKGNNKIEVIDELLKVLHRNKLIKDLKSAREAVLEREKGMSTGMQFGIAIPHARTDSVDRLVCTIGIKKEGIDFNSIDGKPAKIIVLTLSPKSASAPYMYFMSMISQALDENGRKALLSCKSSSEMYQVLTGKHAKK
jgi:Kef-type K+ transport system membrane component KefB/mannitol/fructose-specific phosphotransferase system IIA component (Ntr-type)